MTAPTREQALQLHRAGQLDAADAAYRSLLQQAPDDPTLIHALCVLLLQRGRDTEADARLTALLQRHDAGPAWVLLAQLRRRQGRIGEAITALDRARATGLGDVALDTFDATLRLATGDPRRAEALLAAVIAQTPGHAEAWHVLGQARYQLGRHDDAVAAYREALRRAPDSAPLHFNLGLAAEAAGDLELARTHLDAAAQRAPRMDILGRLAAVQARLFDTAGEAATVARLEQRFAEPGRDTVEPLLLTFLPLSPSAKDAALQRYEVNVRAAVTPLPPPSPPPARDRLRIAYLSPDLGHHAVGGLLRDVFAAHDRSRVEVFAYSQRRHAGDTADAIRAGCDVFRDVADQPPAAVAATIRADAPDVLIDLGGYTHGADARVLALRPVARQAAYLGFIHDHGAEWIDALLLDAVVAPDPTAFAHRVITLPGTLLPGSRTLDATPQREAFDLPPDAVVFASFNTSYKLDAAVLQAWLAIHRAVPHALFLLVLPAPTQRRVRAAWVAGGGNPDMLRFGAALSPDAHARRAASCDLLLDTFRYHAGATAIASVAAGLPILCREGDTPLSRLSASVNRFLGCDDLVCATTDTYIATAAALANDPARLRTLRERVRAAAAARALLDPRRTAAAIEDAMEILCREIPGAAPQ